MIPIEPETRKIIEACQQHASDLFRAAETLRASGQSNFAYHLAALSLEELGKAHLVGMRAMSKRDDDALGWFDKQLEDHVKKLFWAMWGRTLARRPDRREMDSLRDLAAKIHNNRLRGLYVSTDATEFLTPSAAVSEGMLAALMALVENRLALERPVPGDDYAEEDIALLKWFSDASDDPEKRAFIFSSASFDRMEATGSREWLKWLRAEIERVEAEAHASLNRELTRPEPEGEDRKTTKWQLKVRLFTQSHSIRQKVLNRWNERVSWIKLYDVNNKRDQMLVEMTFPKVVSMGMVWQFGLAYANRLLAALNIASGGFFWWYVPAFTSTYYERLIDVENQMTAGIGRRPELKISWPKAVLDDSVLDNIVVCFTRLPHDEDPVQQEPFANYLIGIAFIAKTDIFLQLEGQAYGAFIAALEAGMRVYQNGSSENFLPDFGTLLSRLTSDDEFRTKHIELVTSYRNRTITPGTITLSEVAEMKRICDVYLLSVFAAMEAKNESAGQEGTVEKEDVVNADESSG
jgi:AbiV family abortive infection protein